MIETFMMRKGDEYELNENKFLIVVATNTAYSHIAILKFKFFYSENEFMTFDLLE